MTFYLIHRKKTDRTFPQDTNESMSIVVEHKTKEEVVEWEKKFLEDSGERFTYTCDIYKVGEVDLSKIDKDIPENILKYFKGD